MDLVPAINRPELCRMRVCLLAVVLAFSAPPCLAQTPDVPDWANSFLRSWYSSYNRGDAAAVAALFSEDARLLDLKGRASIRKAMADDFAKTKYQCAGGFDGFRLLGDLAVGWGGESCRETSRDNGKATDTKERWLLVFERAGPNEWLLVRETYENLE